MCRTTARVAFYPLLVFLLTVLPVGVALCAAEPHGNTDPSWWQAFVDEWEPYLKALAAILAVVAGPFAIGNSIFGILRNRREIKLLDEQIRTAAAVRGGETHLVNLLDDPRARAAVRLAMQLVTASAVTLLTAYLLNFIANFFGMFGRELYPLIQGSISAALFIPIVFAAGSLRRRLVK